MNDNLTNNINNDEYEKFIKLEDQLINKMKLFKTTYFTKYFYNDDQLNEYATNFVKSEFEKRKMILKVKGFTIDQIKILNNKLFSKLQDITDVAISKRTVNIAMKMLFEELQNDNIVLQKYIPETINYDTDQISISLAVYTPKEIISLYSNKQYIIKNCNDEKCTLILNGNYSKSSEHIVFYGKLILNDNIEKNVIIKFVFKKYSGIIHVFKFTKKHSIQLQTNYNKLKNFLKQSNQFDDKIKLNDVFVLENDIGHVWCEVELKSFEKYWDQKQKYKLSKIISTTITDLKKFTIGNIQK